MPEPATTQRDTRPATVDLVLLAVTLAAVVALRGFDVLAILIAGFLLKTLDPWSPR
ncbi:hypothetical protein ACWEF6_02815 [Amycolatopsis sp. NPDC004772]